MAKKFVLNTKNAIVNAYDEDGGHHIAWVHPYDKTKIIGYEELPENWPDIHLYVEDIEEYLEALANADWVKNQLTKKELEYFAEATGIPIEEVKAKLGVEGI